MKNISPYTYEYWKNQYNERAVRSAKLKKEPFIMKEEVYVFVNFLVFLGIADTPIENIEFLEDKLRQCDDKLKETVLETWDDIYRLATSSDGKDYLSALQSLVTPTNSENKKFS